VLFGPSGDLSPGYLADMSPIGVSIPTEKQYSPGMEVEVHFGVQDDQASGKLQMRAVIRHCAKGRIGVQFVNVDPSQRDHWWKIMRDEF
jgi:hypothetical protein